MQQVKSHASVLSSFSIELVPGMDFTGGHAVTSKQLPPELEAPGTDGNVVRAARKKKNPDVADKKSEIPHAPGRLNGLSFFSGAMGMDIGLELAGVNVTLACEFDRACRQTILRNKPEIGLIGDILNYTATEILEFAGLERGQVDLIVGGPPCQAFSTAGKRKGFEDERGNVFLTFIDVVLDIRPTYLVIENVRGLLSAPLRHRPHVERGVHAPLHEEELAGGALKHIVDRLEAAGYGVTFNLYNSANFGVPQVRERVVMICHTGGEKLPYLMPTHSNDDAYGLPKWRTVREAIAQLAPGDDHISFPEERLKYFRMLSDGQYWRHLPTELHQTALGASYFSGGGKTGFLRRLAWDKPSCTLVTHPAMPATDICHPDQDRPLSVREYKRIQQFPDDWQLAGSLTDQYKQLGNAVPVGLGKAIGEALYAHAEGRSISPLIDFPFSRYRGTSDRDWTGPKPKKKSKQLDLL